MAAPAHLTILGRTPARVDALVADLQANVRPPVGGGHLPDDLPDAMATHDVVVQGTPIGMYPGHADATPVPRELLRPEQTVFDMVYRPFRTRFIQEAEATGCAIITGAEMLVNQADLQFETWTGTPAPRDFGGPGILVSRAGVTTIRVLARSEMAVSCASNVQMVESRSWRRGTRDGCVTGAGPM